MIRPLFEIVDEREFTNREEELAFLWDLAVQAQERRADSHAIIARKGMGKTALLQRFYNDVFSRQTEVVPFYVSFSEFKGQGRPSLTVRRFMEYYLHTLAIQYVAFHLRDGDLLETDPTDQELLEILRENQAAIPEAAFVVQYLTRSLEMTVSTYPRYLPSVLQFTWRVLGKAGRVPGILMIDEFQVLTDLVDDDSGERGDITEMFQKTAEARWCPMVVTGSAVNLITRTVLGGLLARRFGPYHLQPFTPQHTLECATRLAALNHVPLHEGIAYAIHELTGGNPYYIWRLFKSRGLTSAGLSSHDHLYTVYEYELNQPEGHLRGFWDVHFVTTAAQVNAHGDALRLLYYLATYPEEHLNLHDAAAYLERDPLEVEHIFKSLEQADLVTRGVAGRYRRITDPVLANYILQRYSDVLEQESLATYLTSIKADFRRKMGSLSNAAGHAAELFTIGLLTRFAGQEVDGAACFGLPGMVTLPRFETVKNRSGLIIEGDHIEFDIVAEGAEETWLVEVRHRQKPLGPAAVERFWHKVDEWEGETRPTAWLLSFAGFSAPARERLEASGLRHSGRNGFNLLADAVGYVRFPGS